MSETIQRTRRRSLAAVIGLGALLLGSAGLADSPLAPSSSGDHHKGSLQMALRRGATVPFEAFLPALPSNCEGEIDLKLSWDEDENWVNVKLKGQHVLTPHPTIQRTEGVDYFTNPLWPEEKDFTNGRYLFWILAPSEMITFYYDPVTLDLLGSQYEFPTPPQAIPLPVPGIKLFPTPFFEPDENGDLDFDWTFAYDHVVRGDRPEFSHLFNTYPPSNLCLANPYRYDLSTTIPYISKARPASEARSFSDYLRNGLLFDMTVEPQFYVSEPPVAGQTSFYSGTTAVGGGVPKGWSLDLDAVFMNNAPPIKPFAAAGTCADYFTGQHTRNINFCGPH